MITFPFRGIRGRVGKAKGTRGERPDPRQRKRSRPRRPARPHPIPLPRILLGLGSLQKLKSFTGLLSGFLLGLITID